MRHTPSDQKLIVSGVPSSEILLDSTSSRRDNTMLLVIVIVILPTTVASGNAHAPPYRIAMRAWRTIAQHEQRRRRAAPRPTTSPTNKQRVSWTARQPWYGSSPPVKLERSGAGVPRLARRPAPPLNSASRGRQDSRGVVAAPR